MSINKKKKREDPSYSTVCIITPKVRCSRRTVKWYLSHFSPKKRSSTERSFWLGAKQICVKAGQSFRLTKPSLAAISASSYACIVCKATLLYMLSRKMSGHSKRSVINVQAINPFFDRLIIELHLNLHYQPHNVNLLLFGIPMQQHQLVVSHHCHCLTHRYWKEASQVENKTAISSCRKVAQSPFRFRYCIRVVWLDNCLAISSTKKLLESKGTSKSMEK